MSQYNKTVLTNAGLELAKRANAGQAKFEITRAVTSADDWSNKTIQDIEAVTAIPNIMQQGTIRDTEEVESNNSVIGVSLCFANKDLSAGYQIKIIGVYVKEEGQDKDFLYAVTTAVTPEYMPDFSDGVLYRFNMQMYLVIGKAQAVNVVINDGASVTHGQFDKYKSEVTADLKKIENAHKEDMGHVVKSASINGGNEVLPDENGKIALVVPDPDLSKYVNIDDLKEMLNTKANTSDVYAKSDVDSALAADRGRLDKLEGAQTVDSPDFNSITATGVYYITNNTPANIKNNPASQWGVLVVANGNGNRTSQVYYPDDGSSQWCRLLNGSNWLPWYQLSTKNDVSNAENLANQAQATANTKANSADVYTKDVIDSAFSTRDTNINSLANQVKQTDGETAINDATDVNTLTGTPRQVTIYRLMNTSNTNTPPWLADKRGVMIVLNYDGNVKTQIWTPVGAGTSSASNTDGTFGWRYWEGNTPSAWNRFVSQSYVDGLNTALQNQITTNDNATITTGYDWNTATPTNQSRSLQNAWMVDQQVLGGAVSRMNSTDANVSAVSNKVNVDGPLFKDLTQFNNWSDLFDGYSVSGITSTNGSRLVAFRDDTSGGNTVGSNGAGIAFGGGDTKGVLSVRYGDHIARIAGGNGTSPSWNEDIAWKSDITNLQNQINQQNQTIQSLTTRLTNAENEISYIKANYIEGKQFPASQEAQATAWENANPQRIAFITSN